MKYVSSERALVFVLDRVRERQKGLRGRREEQAAGMTEELRSSEAGRKRRPKRALMCQHALVEALNLRAGYQPASALDPIARRKRGS